MRVTPNSPTSQPRSTTSLAGPGYLALAEAHGRRSNQDDGRARTCAGFQFFRFLGYRCAMSATTATMHSTTLPPEDLEPMLDLSHFLERVTEPAVLVGPDGQTVGLPMEAYRALIDIVRAMSQGRAITVAPVDQLLTTQEAADFLGISRPTLVKLLESGRIPFKRPTASRHRRVQLADVVAYQRQSARDRSDALDTMTREAAEAGLYDDSAADYAAALRRARKN